MNENISVDSANFAKTRSSVEGEKGPAGQPPLSASLDAQARPGPGAGCELAASLEHRSQHASPANAVNPALRLRNKG